MGRINISINDELYEAIEKIAKKKGVTVNNYVYAVLAEKFSGSDYNILEEYQHLKEEAVEKALKDPEGQFTLNDLPTFKNLESKPKETNYPESVSQVKIRLSKMFYDNDFNNEWQIKNSNVVRIKPDPKMLDRLLAYHSLMTKMMNKDNEQDH